MMKLAISGSAPRFRIQPGEEPRHEALGDQKEGKVSFSPLRRGANASFPPLPSPPGSPAVNLVDGRQGRLAEMWGPTALTHTF